MEEDLNITDFLKIKDEYQLMEFIEEKYYSKNLNLVQQLLCKMISIWYVFCVLFIYSSGRRGEQIGSREAVCGLDDAHEHLPEAWNV